MLRLTSALAALFLCAAPALASDVRSIVAERALANGVPPRFANAIAHVETRHRCHVTGRAGERGVGQVRPATARSVGIHGNLYDCRTGAEASARYLRLALIKARGNLAGAA